jgi:ribosomal protein L13E
VIAVAQIFQVTRKRIAKGGKTVTEVAATGLTKTKARELAHRSNSKSVDGWLFIPEKVTA